MSATRNRNSRPPSPGRSNAISTKLLDRHERTASAARRAAEVDKGHRSITSLAQEPEALSLAAVVAKGVGNEEGSPPDEEAPSAYRSLDAAVEVEAYAGPNP